MFDTRLHEYWEPPRCERSSALVDRMCASWRLEAQVVADRLDAVGELFELRRAQRGEELDWAVDTWAAVAAEVAAAFRVSLAMAGSFLRYALAMRQRLPRVAAVFRAGDISYRLFQTIVYRTDLITDTAVLAAVDAELAVRAARWPSMTRGRLAGEIDKIVAKADVDAVRRREQCRAERGVSIEDLEGGMSEIHGSLFSPDAHALDQRLDALAATVCEHDPRGRDQLRADALGALAASADRMGCRCGRSDCAARTRPPATPVVIHVIAEQASVRGQGSAPASEVGADGLITAELVAELAGSATLVPLSAPAEAEARYTPSAKLADFVRCRDLTCRAPGCDRPAVDCDIDHTMPYSQGGATHPSNLKCLCRQHHLLKTFWGWRDEQLPDGTLIWRLPGGHTYVTTPGSALLFPSLCAPTGDLPAATAVERCAERTAMMPRRTRTRAQDRAQRIATERHHNRRARLATQPARPGPAPPDDEPPPF
ncbi:HNH endonuclease [Mycobacterium sp. SMC-2]|uniref:HNH endonuclease signature motif containing protein n=1 Tax=Mycobacterium sp. SMC-2 TaxID=2857058 RepID=UPI0021B1BACE|nr:HNH endonuclease signature motif containing protein [Mycobacterium sp. SMC-2]UXA07705.1 HNH endonuclease [Mycobacterium sp. SMC-2]